MPSDGFWSAFPDHDPRFLSGQMSLEEVTAEYRARAAEKKAREDEYYGRDRPPFMPGVPVGEDGVPRQVSRVHRDVPELASERDGRAGAI